MHLWWQYCDQKLSLNALNSKPCNHNHILRSFCKMSILVYLVNREWLTNITNNLTTIQWQLNMSNGHFRITVNDVVSKWTNIGNNAVLQKRYFRRLINKNVSHIQLNYSFYRRFHNNICSLFVDKKKKTKHKFHQRINFKLKHIN